MGTIAKRGTSIDISFLVGFPKGSVSLFSNLNSMVRALLSALNPTVLIKSAVLRAKVMLAFAAAVKGPPIRFSMSRPATCAPIAIFLTSYFSGVSPG
jgi:hypothetical protein